MSVRHRPRRFLVPPWLALVNVLLCAAAIAANARYQVFCRPVPWATAVLVTAFTPVILFPLLHTRLQRWKAIILFFFGIAACICVYMIVFLREMNLFGWFGLLGKPYILLTYVPHFFLLQIILHVFRGSGSRPFRKFFFAGAGLCALYAVTMAVWFNLYYATVRAALAGGDPKVVPRNYMTERMLGMHFKYHLSFCPYDGWRPPLHDPSVVVAVWLTAPFRSDLDDRGFAREPHQRNYGLDARIAAYKAVFPELPVRQGCSCAEGYRKRYLNDPILH